MAKPCKEWSGCLNRQGYGKTTARVGGKTVYLYVHRKVWAGAHGPIPRGLCVLHRCDNPSCYELSHLFLGTNSDNTRDMMSKGRNYTGVRPRGEEHGRAKLTPSKVKEIRRRLKKGESQSSLGREFSVSNSAIYAIEKRKNWVHI